MRSLLHGSEEGSVPADLRDIRRNGHDRPPCEGGARTGPRGRDPAGRDGRHVRRELPGGGRPVDLLGEVLGGALGGRLPLHGGLGLRLHHVHRGRRPGPQPRRARRAGDGAGGRPPAGHVRGAHVEARRADDHGPGGRPRHRVHVPGDGGLQRLSGPEGRPRGHGGAPGADGRHIRRLRIDGAGRREGREAHGDVLILRPHDGRRDAHGDREGRR